MEHQQPSLTFLYLGRRGALGQFTRELMQAAARVPDWKFDFIVSADSDLAGELDGSQVGLLSVPTFSRASPLSVLKNYVSARRVILQRLEQTRPRAVVTLMPHVWTPLLAPAIKKLGIKYAPIIHDAHPHPGDKTAWLTRWLRRDCRHADLVITLSRAVAEGLKEQRLADQGKILPLFHPDLVFQSNGQPRVRDPQQPLRLIFFGRVMAYKGLAHLIEAVAMLRQEGVNLELGLAGSGDLSNSRAQLEGLGAEIINRWIDEREVTAILDRYDAVACPHVEASQSGVAAAALGHCMPVVAMPIGGITEQVIDSETGVLAKRVTTRAFADAAHRLAVEPDLYDRISAHQSETAGDRSMSRFLQEILAETV
jgi:glycosyltransferase involved in cell wall biosynthesis